MIRAIILLTTLFLFSSCARPVANFISDKDEGKAPEKIKFTNQSEKAESYEWDFGDGNTSSVENPEHKYYLSGNYTVKLKAKAGEKSSIMEKNIKIDAPDQCLVEIETDFGSMLVRLFDETPHHRDNFIKLAEEEFFDGLIFHRVIDGFMIQGGDPKSKDAGPGVQLGSGGPGYQIPAEFNDDYVHIKGALAAARMGDQVNPEKKSSGSQFYIVHGNPVEERTLDRMEIQKGISYTDEQRKIYIEQGGTPFLDKEYTVFGQVVSGLEVIDAIASQPTGPADRPNTNISMKVRVIK